MATELRDLDMFGGDGGSGSSGPVGGLGSLSTFPADDGDDDDFFGGLSDPTASLSRSTAPAKTAEPAPAAIPAIAPSAGGTAETFDSGELFGYATPSTAAAAPSDGPQSEQFDPFGYTDRYTESSSAAGKAAGPPTGGAAAGAATGGSLFGAPAAAGTDGDFLAYLAKPEKRLAETLSQPPPQQHPPQQSPQQAPPPQQSPVQQRSQFDRGGPQPAWSELRDDYGRTYYHNRLTNKTSWDKPMGEVAAPPATQSVAPAMGPGADGGAHDAAAGEAAAAAAPAWTALQDNRGRTYYFNDATGESRWDKPAELLAAEAGLAWEERVDRVGRIYYYNRETGNSQWEEPAELKPPEAKEEYRDPRAPAISTSRVEVLPSVNSTMSTTSTADTGAQYATSASLWQTQQLQPPQQHIQPPPQQLQQPQPQPPQPMPVEHPSPAQMPSRTLLAHPAHPVQPVHTAVSSLDGQATSTPRETAQPVRAAAGQAQTAIDPDRLDRRAVQHCVAAFGFGGQLVTVFPRVKLWSAGSGGHPEAVATVNIWPTAKTVDRQPWARSLIDYPGPLPSSLVSNAAKFQAVLTQFVSDQAAVAAAQTDARLRGRDILWLFLHHLLDNRGALQPADNFAALLRQSANDTFSSGLGGGSGSGGGGSGGGGSLLLHPESSLEPEKALAVSKRVQALLLSGRSAEACEHAMKSELWDVAIMLAATMDQQLWPTVTLRWAQSRFRPGTPSSLLMHVMTGHQGLAFEADAAPVAVQDWRRNLEILLVSQATGDEGCEAIHALGDGLHADGQLYPAHLCWIMAGISDLELQKMPLVGAVVAPGQLPGGILRDVIALQLTDVYEFTRRLVHGETGALQAFQPIKLLYAQLLVEVGLTSRAKLYAAQIDTAIQATGQQSYQAVFLEQLAEFRRRLGRDCAMKGHFSGPGAAPARTPRPAAWVPSAAEQQSGAAAPTLNGPVPAAGGGQNWGHGQATGNPIEGWNQQQHHGGLGGGGHMPPTLGGQGQQQWAGQQAQGSATSGQLLTASGQPLTYFMPGPAPIQQPRGPHTAPPTPHAGPTPDASKAAAVPAAGAPATPAAASPAVKGSPAPSSGWVGSLVGRLVFGQKDEMEGMHADPMAMYFDEKLKKWVDPSNPDSMEPDAPLAPPPMAGGGAAPAEDEAAAEPAFDGNGAPDAEAEKLGEKLTNNLMAPPPSFNRKKRGGKRSSTPGATLSFVPRLPGGGDSGSSVGGGVPGGGSTSPGQSPSAAEGLTVFTPTADPAAAPSNSSADELSPAVFTPSAVQEQSSGGADDGFLEYRAPEPEADPGGQESGAGGVAGEPAEAEATDESAMPGGMPGMGGGGGGGHNDGFGEFEPQGAPPPTDSGWGVPESSMGNSLLFAPDPVQDQPNDHGGDDTAAPSAYWSAGAGGGAAAAAVPEPGPTRYWSTNSTGGPQDDAAGDQTAAGTDSAAVAAAADAASDDRSAEQRDSLAGAAGDAQGKMANGQETAASAANLGGAPDFDDDDDAPDFDDETTPRDKWGGAAGQPAAAGSDPAPPDVAQDGSPTEGQKDNDDDFDPYDFMG